MFIKIANNLKMFIFASKFCLSKKVIFSVVRVRDDEFQESLSSTFDCVLSDASCVCVCSLLQMQRSILRSNSSTLVVSAVVLCCIGSSTLVTTINYLNGKQNFFRLRPWRSNGDEMIVE